MRIYLAGTQGRRWCVDDCLFSKGGQKFKYEQVANKNMNLFLAGQAPWKEGGAYDKIIQENHPSILESFYYADKWTVKTLPFLKNFLLDSGAFTFFSANKEMNWNSYLERYAKFVVDNNIKHFFELDIDSLVGYQKVKEFRKTLESLTGKQCIPVWHTSRGNREWSAMAEEYPYIAIGGIVSKEISQDQYKYFPAMIKEAHKYNAKVHGLGFTALAYLDKIHFDSVDSTAWTTGNRFGFVYKFNGRTMVKIEGSANQRLKDAKAVAVNNFNEWVKFQRYAENHL